MEVYDQLMVLENLLLRSLLIDVLLPSELFLRLVLYKYAGNVADYSLLVFGNGLWNVDELVEVSHVGVGVLGSWEEEGVEVHDVDQFDLKYISLIF